SELHDFSLSRMKHRVEALLQDFILLRLWKCVDFPLEKVVDKSTILCTNSPKMHSQIVKAQKRSIDLEAVRGPSEGTTATYRAYIQGFTKSAYPQTVEGFASYIASITGKRPAASVNLAIAAGKTAFLQAAIRAGMDTRELTLLKGALSEIPTVRRQMADVKVVTAEERLRLFAALPLKVRLIAETLYQTGARVSEIVGLRRERVKVNGNVELRLFGKGSKE